MHMQFAGVYGELEGTHARHKGGQVHREALHSQAAAEQFHFKRNLARATYGTARKLLRAVRRQLAGVYGQLKASMHATNVGRCTGKPCTVRQPQQNATSCKPLHCTKLQALQQQTVKKESWWLVHAKHKVACWCLWSA
jgi:hypothetical protein